IEDAVSHDSVVQVAYHPLAPYGFAVYWWNRPYVANEALAPPALAYWWATAVSLFGEQPILWKLWLLPFSFLFIWSLHALCRRFARGLEMPLVWMTVLSPTFLPGLNLMLDVPALALALASLVVFIDACDRASFAEAVLPGIVAGLAGGIGGGLAAETKYTGLLAPVTMLLYAVVFGKFPLWPAAALPAVQVFLTWEFLIALLYGESHFLGASRGARTDFWEKAGLTWPL